jgi:hypothetical protein
MSFYLTMPDIGPKEIENLLDSNPSTSKGIPGNEQAKGQLDHDAAILNVSSMDSVMLDPTPDAFQRSKAYNIGLGLLNSSSGFYFGYMLTILNPLGEKLYRLHFMSQDVNSDLSNAVSMLLLGTMFGALVSGPLSTNFGRVRTLIASEFFILGLYGLILWDNSFVFLVNRFLTGAACAVGNV